MANQITVFLDPTQMPAQGQPQATLDANVAQLFANLPVFGAQFNAAVAGVNASLNGAGISIPYTIDLSSTADSDPGAGKLRFGSATQNASTVLRLDLLSSNTADYTAVLDTFDASTSTIKGRIALVKQGDAKTFLIFDVTARAAPAGYRNITVTPVASSSANPFGAGDAVLLYFQRTGDAGAGASYQLLASAPISGTPTTIDFLSIFTASYDKYVVEMQGVTSSSAGVPTFVIAKAGAVDSGNNIAYGSSGGAPTSAGSTYAISSATASKFTATLEVLNANDTSANARVIRSQSASYNAGNSFPSITLSDFAGAYLAAGSISGFRLQAGNGGTFTGGTVRVYGVKNG